MIELDTNDEAGRPARRPVRPPKADPPVPRWIEELDEDEGPEADEEK